MLTIKQDIIDSSLLFEAVIDDNIRKLINQVKQSGNPKDMDDLKALFKTLEIKIDKLDPSVLRTYDLKDSDEKKIAEKLYDKAKTTEVACFFLKNGVVYVCFYNNRFKIIRSKGVNDEWDIKKEIIGDSWGKFTKPALFKHADEMWAINRSKVSSNALKRERYEAKLGMWENTPKFYEQIKAQNLKRYKEAITKAKAAKGDIKTFYDKLLKAQEKYYNYLTTINPAVMFDRKSGELRNAMDSANYYLRVLFDNIDDISNVIEEIKVYGDDSYLLRDYNRKESRFNDNYNAIIENFDKIEDILKTIKQE